MANAKRRCTGCKERFPADQMIKLPVGWFHSRECAFQYSKAKGQAAIKRKQAAKEKAERKHLRERKQALKTKGEWLKEAQAAFNRFIRFRDLGKECISCEAILTEKEVGGGYDAGHYLSRGARGQLRFDEDNCHGQCKRCNRYLSGNIAPYRIKLIARIGIESVLRLESDQSVEIRTIEHYRSVKKEYQAKANQLKKQHDSKLGAV